MIEGAFRRMTGLSEVTEENGQIIVSGVSAEYLARDMKRIWTTSKIASAMFTKVTWSDVRIPSFFGLELEYILNRMLESRGLDTPKRVIKNIIEGLNTNTWIRNIGVPTTPWFNRTKLKEIIYDQLLPHQMDFINKYEHTVRRYGLNGMLLSAPPGSGKTVTGCAIALGTEAEVVIVICPKNAAIRVWQKTLQKEFKIPQNPYVAELDGAIQPKKKWHIFHYEALDRALELAKTVQGKKVCVILDESHNFNEIKSLRTERFLKLCRLTNSKDIIWASGTPIKAMGFEAIPLLRSIDPLFSQVTEEAFRKMFGRDAKRTLDILAYRIGLISHTVPKQEVMSDRPEWETITVKMPGSEKYTLSHLTKVMNEFITERTAFYKKNYSTYRKIYDDAIEFYRKTLTTKLQIEEFKEYQQNIAYLIRNGFDARRDGDIAVLTNRYEKEKIHPVIPQEMRKPFADAKSVIKYVDLKVRGECLGRILTKERIQCHVDMVHHVNFDSMIKGVKKKTIIFTSYVKVVDEAFEVLSKKYKPLRVYGDTNNDLVQIVNKFEKDQTANPLITTYMSLSTAVPLVMANGVIFLNSPWRSYERDQAVARAHRIGQDTTVYCFEIILDTGKEQNISSRSLDIMQWSRDQVDVIMGFTGDLKISVECNGFDIPMTVDFNEVLDDVLYDPDQTELLEVKPRSEMRVDEVSVESLPLLYPSDYLFYAKK